MACNDWSGELVHTIELIHIGTEHSEARATYMLIPNRSVEFQEDWEDPTSILHYSSII